MVTWTKDKVQINVIGYEMHNLRFSMKVGLTDNSQIRDLENGINKLKKQGLTEEDLGK